jgi:D-alanyl-D-alanine carboxypeptidase (penicillin-binding protein 5/6)
MIQDRATRGIFALSFFGLLFFASAIATFFYLSEAPSASATSQTATVAPAVDPFADLSLLGKAIYVEDLTNGKILYERNAQAQLPLASLTKVATALAVSGVLSRDQLLTLPKNLYAADGSAVLLGGQTWHERDIMNFTLVSSSNDGANYFADEANDAIHAKYTGSPSTGATLWRMNDIARNLGLSDTYFLNPSGLDISPTQSGGYGSARDVGKLFAYAASTTPTVFSATTRGQLTLTSVDGARVGVANTDLALSSIPGIVMGKTGYTDLAGGNLAIIFNVGLSHPVVAVVLGSTYEGRFADMRALVAAATTAIQSTR